MKLKTLLKVLKANILFIQDEQLELNMVTVAASDLMSTILALVNVPDILLTALNNAQVINTSSVFGIKAVVLVTCEEVDSKLIELAKKEGVALLVTSFCMYEACGLLYTNGLLGITQCNE